MATVKNAWSGVASSAETLGQNAGNAFGKLGAFISDTVSGSTSNAGRFGSGVATVAKQPMKWLAYGVNVPIKMVNFAFSRAPILTAGATVLGGAMVAGKWLNGRAERRTQNEMAAQFQQPVSAPAGAGYGGYQVSPEEVAAMEARMRGGDGMSQQGFAERVKAGREPVTPTGTPLAQL